MRPLTGLRRRLPMLALLLSLLLLAMAAGIVNKRLMVLQTVRLEGGDNRMKVAAATVLELHRGKSLLNLDLMALKRQLINITGVSRVHLRRVLPSTLHAVLEQHQPLARWDGGGMVDIHGERYTADGGGDLPIFKGNAGAARSMTAFYRDAIVIIGDGIAQLELSPGGSWTVFLRDGLVLYLGRDLPRQKLRLYVSHADTLRRRFPALSGVDLRNENGFTVISGDNAAKEGRG